MRVLAILCALCAVAAAAPHRVNGYVRGRAVKLDVVEVGWAMVERKTARAFLAMREAAAQDGIELVIWSGFRSNERQAALYRRWRAGHGNVAAKPGHSRHQSGHALDISLDADTLAWLNANAKRYGFKRTVRGEPWHWEYTGTPRRRALARAANK